MEPTDLTIEILKGIREEGRKTNERLDVTNDRLDELRIAMVDRIERVERCRRRPRCDSPPS